MGCGQIGGRDGCYHDSNEFDREEVYKNWRNDGYDDCETSDYETEDQ